jgi:hypothetical protein
MLQRKRGRRGRRSNPARRRSVYATLTDFSWSTQTSSSLTGEDDVKMWETAARLKKRLQQFTTSAMLESMIVFKNTDHSWTKEFIKDIDKITPVVEIGDKKNCLHAHFCLSIHHYSCINLDYGKVKQFFKDGFQGVVLMQTYRNDISINDYVSKNLAPLKISCKVTENSSDVSSSRSNERSEDSSLAQES